MFVSYYVGAALVVILGATAHHLSHSQKTNSKARELSCKHL